MKLSILVPLIVLLLPACTIRQDRSIDRWDFIGLAHPWYYGGLGYTGDATFAGKEVTFRFSRAREFPPESSRVLEEVFPKGDWGKRSLEYKAVFELTPQGEKEGLGTFHGPPFDGMPFFIHTEGGVEHLFIGSFDPPFLFTRKAIRPNKPLQGTEGKAPSSSTAPEALRP